MRWTEGTEIAGIGIGSSRWQRELRRCEVNGLRPRDVFRHCSPGTLSVARLVREFGRNGFEAGEPVAESLTTLALAEVFAVLRNRSASPRPSGVRTSLSPQRLQSVTQFIEANLGRDLPIAEIAGVVGLSPFHFSRCFKAAVGISPGAFLRRRRIERASMLRVDTDRDIAQLAYSCGFSSQSHFTGAFRRETGESPGRYRRRNSSGPWAEHDLDPRVDAADPARDPEE